MPSPLDVAACQPPCAAHDVTANAQAHAAAVRAARSRVVVFPELSLTGYELDAEAVPADDERLLPLISACAETNSIALAGAPVAGAGGRVHIGILAVDGRGARVVYRKMWLGDEETVRFAAGSAPAAIEVDGWRLGLGVCRDTGFRRHSADTAALGVDAYVAGTLMRPDEAAEQDARARRNAITHDFWVVVASFAGATGAGYDTSAGGSGIWNRSGIAVAHAGDQVGEFVRATLT